MDDELLTGDRIRALLNMLGDELARRGKSGELFVVGGAAMALGYNAREATRDIDALFEPKTVIYDAAARVAELESLQADWLNDAMKGFLHGADPDQRIVLEHPALCVSEASPKYLLAMKLQSARIERDADDIALLLELAGIDDVDAALGVVESAYGRDRVTVKPRLLVETILNAP